MLCEAKLRASSSLRAPIGLAYADFGTYLVQQGDGTGHPRQYAYRTYCSHGLTAQTSYPCHVCQAVGHWMNEVAMMGIASVNSWRLMGPCVKFLVPCTFDVF